MRKFLLLSAVSGLAVILAGPVVADKKFSQLLPIHGSFSGQLLEFNFLPDVIANRCPDTPADKDVIWVASFEGWGNITHLGRTYFYAEHCSYGTPGLPPIPDGTYGQGEFMMIAANGDVLKAEYGDGIAYPLEPPAAGFEDTITFIDGGTGRFRFASGEAYEVGSVNLPPLGDGALTAEMHGTISYSKN
ncbi:MAG: hypothetical protein KJP17_06540 [Gammaproteobacteria bacterium]|nr:hypothetical protein [Gammaproteobacteria bacterium]